MEELLHEDQVVTSPVDAVEFGVPGVRISAHIFNTDEELTRLLAGIRRIQTKYS